MHRSIGVRFLSLGLLLFVPVFGVAQAARLSIEPGGGQQVRLSWPDDGTEYVLERVTDLDAGGEWAEWGVAPAVQGGRQVVVLVPGAAAEYYRLRELGPRLTRVALTSPADGEAGVSVLRETVVEFTRPLSEGTVLGVEDMEASLGGRRLLSRAVISADRRRATLFYLEPLPAGARIKVALRGNGLLDAEGVAVDADGDGVAGGTAVVEFDTMSTAAVPGTAVVGRVYASDPVAAGGGFVNRPLEGVIVTVDGAEETLRAVTDSEGYFRLEPSPAGRFFVHIDGRLAVGSDWPGGAYYPYVGKTFEALAGQTNNPAGGTGEIFLPLVKAGTLQPVSVTEPTTVTFPDEVLSENPGLAGVSVTVPANALFADGGARGGRVGIAPVAPDRIPSPLPAGLEFPLVITIQTDGPTNFDEPVPVRFPNLPDPVTGRVLGAGAKTWLWSFNHDTGRWEPQGPMTISADGLYAETDPGVGVLQPGWHGVNPSTPPVFPAEPEPEEKCDPPGLMDILELAGVGGECLDKLTKIGSVLDLSVTAATKSVEAGFKIHTAIEAIAAGDSGKAAKPAVGALKDFKDAVASLVELGAKQTPDDKFLNAVICLLKIQKEEWDIVCKTLDCLFPSKPEWLFGCKPLEFVVETADKILSSWDLLKDGIREQPFDALSLALDALEKGLPEDVTPNLVGRHGGPGLQDLLTPEEIVMHLEAAEAAMNELVAMTEGVPELAGWVNELLAAADPTVVQGPSVMLSRYQLYEEVYYRLAYEGFEFRGRSTALGAFEFPPMPADTDYVFSVYVPELNVVAEVAGRSAGAGQRTLIPDPVLQFPGVRDLSGDTDLDGLTDLAESVIGARADQVDTDGDGLSDYVEVSQGLNPLSGLNLPVGIIASRPLDGEAERIVLDGSLALLATGSHGLAVVDIGTATEPVLLAELELPGFNREIVYSPAVRVAALVAESLTFSGSDFGIHLVSLSDPGAPRLIRTMAVKADAVAERDGLLYAAVGRQLRTYDIATGLELGWMPLNDPPDRMVVGRKLLVLASGETLRFLVPDGTAWTEVGSLQLGLGASVLLIDGDTLFVGTFQGYFTLDTSDPGAPVVTGQPPITQLVVHAMALDGSGLVAAVTSFAGPTTLDFSVYDGRDRSDVTRFLNTIATPGAAKDVAVSRGVAYVADGRAGLQVINSLSFDNQGQPPAVTLDLAELDVDSMLPGVQVVAGSVVRVEAAITDDVQIREARLLLNGEVVASVAAGPVGWPLTIPADRPPGTRLTLQAEAVDTGGNVGMSDAVEVEVVADEVAPGLGASLPRDGGAAFAAGAMVLRFDESIQPIEVPQTVTLTHLGADREIGGGDDVAVLFNGFDVVGGTLTLTPGGALERGFYELRVSGGAVRDLSGNSLGDDLVLRFMVVDAAPDVAVWISPDDGRFDDPENWLHGRVPAEEEVLLPAVLGQPVVTVATKDNFLAKLESQLPLRLEGGAELEVRNLWWATAPVVISNSFAYADAEATFDAPVHLTGSTLQSYGAVLTFNQDFTIDRGSKLTLDGAAAELTINGALFGVNFTLTAQDGAVVSLSQLTDYEGLGDFTMFLPAGTEFRATGLGSRVILPELVAVNGPVGSNVRGTPAIRFDAWNGGRVEIPKLAVVRGRSVFDARGAGSVVAAPLLQSMTGPESSLISAIGVSGAGEVQLGGAVTLSNVNITLQTEGVIRATELELLLGSSLRGVGVVSASVVNGGLIFLDRAPGSLVIEGDLAMTETAVLEARIGLGTDGTGAGHLDARGGTVLGGTLKVNLANGYTPAAGDAFEVAGFLNTPTGVFAGIDDSGLGAGLGAAATVSPERLEIGVVTWP